MKRNEAEAKAMPELRKRQDMASTVIDEHDKQVQLRMFRLPLVRSGSDNKIGGMGIMADSKESLYTKTLLKPCKRCGREAVLVTDLYGTGDDVIYYVVCGTAKCRLEHPPKLYVHACDAVDAWNKEQQRSDDK